MGDHDCNDLNAWARGEWYDDDGDDEGHEPFSVGLATPFTATDLAVQFITRNHGALWIPKKGIHDDSSVWKVGQPEGELVITEWCAEKKDLLG